MEGEILAILLLMGGCWLVDHIQVEVKKRRDRECWERFLRGQDCGCWVRGKFHRWWDPPQIPPAPPN